jgi:glycine/D-amino acid oxidase-like deaminating enzyme
MNLTDVVDVLVVGFGAAGASAAITAHDAGASVAVVEKTDSGGGNCVHSGGFLFEVDGPHAVEHLDALCFGSGSRWPRSPELLTSHRTCAPSSAIRRSPPRHSSTRPAPPTRAERSPRSSRSTRTPVAS